MASPKAPPKPVLAAARAVLALGGLKLLFYHRDCDGATSAAQLLRIDPSFAAEPLESPRLPEKRVAKLLEGKPVAVIFVDLPVDQDWQAVEKLAKQLPATLFLIVDHHPVTKDINGLLNVVHWNPRFADPAAYVPSSAQAYFLLRALGQKTEPWIAGIGVLGDYAQKTCADVLQDCKKLDPELLRPAKELRSLKRPAAFRTNLGMGTELVNAAVTARGAAGAKEALAELVHAPDHTAFLANPKLRADWAAVKQEIARVIAEAEKGKEAHRGLAATFFTVDSPMTITSVISTLLSEKHPKQTLLIRKKHKDGWKVSLRNQAGLVDVGELAKRASDGIGSGGGHEKAAGAFVTDWDEFRGRVLAFLEEWKTAKRRR